MVNSIESYINKLEEYINEAHEKDDCYLFQDSAFDIMDEIELLDNAKDFIEPIFRLIERSPSIDFGGPGPLSSFLENFYKSGYEEKLIESIQRKPTDYTLSLLSYICNDKNNPDRKKYIDFLNSFNHKTFYYDLNEK